jgi:hypothetical protein
LTVFLQSPSGGFSTSPDFYLGDVETTERPGGLAAADLNGDGLLDLVSASWKGGNLAVFFQAEEPLFSAVPDHVLGGLSSGANLVAVFASDLNDDGLLDLISANESGNRLIVYSQLAPGLFTEASAIVVGDKNSTNGPRFLVTADLNGDGSLDLASANRRNRTLTIFLNR